MDNHSNPSVEELEKDIASLVAMMSDLYEKVHRVERVLFLEGTIEPEVPEVDERGSEGLLLPATEYVQQTGRCSVSLLQKHFKISYKRAFVLLDALQHDGIIAPYRNEPERVVNQ